MEENKKSVDRVLTQLAEAVDILQNTLPGKMFIVNQFDEQSYKGACDMFEQNSDNNQFIIDISGTQFIFLKNE